MIVAIEGEIVKKEPTLLHLKTYGITRAVNISLNCSAKIEGKEISLHITQILKEDSDNLYGFLDMQEKLMFDRLIKINGIGPSTALAVCSTFAPDIFAKIVISNDVNSIKMVPGIGPKTAKRVLVELSDFSLDSFEDSKDKAFSEALEALESLGFKKDTVRKILIKCDAKDTPSLIKEALKKLS
ncbi:MAG: Holliday junction branch migration protein RuvA [Epsilonproteobacteria bacterium]|nr:Holliday junction branch migration protein RuvA [Campylobacterota bacterium]